MTEGNIRRAHAALAPAFDHVGAVSMHGVCSACGTEEALKSAAGTRAGVAFDDLAQLFAYSLRRLPEREGFYGILIQEEGDVDQCQNGMKFLFAVDTLWT
jgi:hypothetical protein